MSKLKPCPFCGGEAELCYGPGLGTGSCRGYTLYASCNECGAKSPGLWQEKKPEPNDQSWEGAADDWNSRPGEPDPENCGVAFCEHYSEGLPVCSKCREESALAHDKACAELADCKADRVAISQKLSDALDALFASNKQLAEANRKLAERINDDQRYLVAPLCNAEKALDDCQAELKQARAEIENLRFMVHNQRCCRNCGNHASWQFDICGFGENPQDENEGPHCRRNDLKRWRPMEYRRAKEAAERATMKLWRYPQKLNMRRR